jgi:hypothetical protein
MKRNYYYSGREYPYKNIKPRIICEQYMTDESGVELKDYKVFCFNGEPKYILVDYGRHTGRKRNTYDTGWNLVPVVMNYHPYDEAEPFKKPKVFGEMLEIASRMSERCAFLRVDFYIVKDRLYLGELTFTPSSGTMNFDPPEYDAEFGNLLVLPGKQ